MPHLTHFSHHLCRVGAKKLFHAIAGSPISGRNVKFHFDMPPSFRIRAFVELSVFSVWLATIKQYSLSQLQGVIIITDLHSKPLLHSISRGAVLLSGQRQRHERDKSNSYSASRPPSVGLQRPTASFVDSSWASYRRGD